VQAITGGIRQGRARGDRWDAGDALGEGWTCEQARALVADAMEALVPKRDRPPRADLSDGSDTEERAPRPRHKDALLDIIDSLELWNSRDKIPFATVPVGTHFENDEIRSRGFRLWLGHEFFKATRAAASSQATEEALRPAESLALYRGTEHEPFIRHGHEASGEVLYLDMCDDASRAIRISAGGWEVVANPAVKFIRSDHMQPLPIAERPAPGTHLGKQLYEDIGALVPLVTEGAITMIISWLVMNFHPNGPYPILDLYGADGSAKTSTARRIKRFTDPDDLKDRSPPRDELGLWAMARNAWVVAIDNLSYLAPWLSDCMCRLSTGAGISGRSLYTNADEFWYRLKRPQPVTGIPKLVERADFASRTIYVELPAIPESQRLIEEECEREFVARWPRILGCLLEVIARTLASAVRPANLPRMADFGVWMARATTALGWHPNKFTEAYNANRAPAAMDVVERDTIGPPILELIDSQQVTERPDGRLTQRWEGTATALLNALPVTPKAASRKASRTRTLCRTICADCATRWRRRESRSRSAAKTGHPAKSAPRRSSSSGRSSPRNGLPPDRCDAQMPRKPVSPRPFSLGKLPLQPVRRAGRLGRYAFYSRSLQGLVLITFRTGGRFGRLVSI